jgi:opacity protein-like surface antigen
VKRILLCATICLISASALQAQDSFFSSFTGAIGAGITLPVARADDFAGTGGHFMAAAGPRFNSRTSLLLDFGYHDMDVDFAGEGGNETLIDGGMRVWSLTLNPQFEWIRAEHFTSYVTGGYGVYNRQLEVTQADFDEIECDDWWDACVPDFDGDSVIAESDTYKMGFNVGTGVTFGSNIKFFVEARYHRMFNTDADTQFVPITFGIRW